MAVPNAPPRLRIMLNTPDAANFLGKQPPKLEEVREALSRIVEAGTQATESIERIRNLFKKRDPQKAPVDIVFTERGLRDESSTAAPPSPLRPPHKRREWPKMHGTRANLPG